MRLGVVAMHKIFTVFISLPLIVIVGCGGGGSASSGGGGGGLGSGSCTAIMLSPYVDSSECWEYSSDETNATTHCTTAGGVYSALACDETGKIATCTTMNSPGSLTGSLFTVYWFSGSYPLDFTTECSGTLSGALTSS